MGYGPIVNGKQTPITPWVGSWAWEQEQRRLGLLPKKPDNQWPIGTRAQETKYGK